MCSNYQIKEKIFHDLCCGFFRIFRSKMWKIGRQHPGQSGQLRIVTFLKPTRKALSKSGQKLYSFFASINSQILPVAPYELRFFDVSDLGAFFSYLFFYFTPVMGFYHIVSFSEYGVNPCLFGSEFSHSCEVKLYFTCNFLIFF